MSVVTVKKGMEYDLRSDSIYDCPVCPECETPIFGVKEADIGKEKECICCNTKVLIPDEPWVRKYIEDNTGTRTEQDVCKICGGTVERTVTKINGRWQTISGICKDCGLRYLV